MVLLTSDEIVVAPGEANHTVARAWFDVAEERVSNCWCIPLTKKAGLLLLRDEDTAGFAAWELWKCAIWIG